MPAEFPNLLKLQRRDPKLRFRYDDRLHTVQYLRGNLANIGSSQAEAVQTAGLKFLKAHRDLFGPVAVDDPKVLESTPDPHGGLSLTLQQYYGPYRVYGGSIRFHVNGKGVLDTVNNRLFPDLEQIPREPRITEAQAVEIVKERLHARGKPRTAPELLVYRHEGKARLAWEIRMEGGRPDPDRFVWRKPHDEPLGRIQDEPLPYWVAYVDAVTGELFFYYNNLQTAGPTTGSGTGYYSGAGTVQDWYTNTTYQLRDTTRTAGSGPEIIVNDEDGASPSEDADNNWNDLTASPRDRNQGAEVDAHRYAAQVADYFRTVHGRNGFDGHGANMSVLVHYGSNLNNGYWDGLRVKLGDGDGVVFDYCCSDDWLAHEFTHAYTQYTCGLQYWSESGALNEAFSDIFAAFITGDWLIFEDNWLQTHLAPAARNMIDPTNGGLWNVADPISSVLAGHQPSHYSTRYTGGSDYGGVHINSGIINNLFYLLTVGGTHAVSNITVQGIGQSAAERMLFRCMSVNLVGNPTATFFDFREAMLDACQELFPEDLEKLSQVKNAFNAVGIGPDIYVRDNLADTGQEPYPGAYLWASPDIINRTALSPNPTVDFANLSNDALWQNVEFGQDNYVYVRLQNRGSHAGDATINVYFSAATTFGTPASWTSIGTLTEPGITPGAVRIAGPLTFPKALIPAPAHYCMIAVVSDPLDPAPDHTLIDTVAEYLEFVRNTNNIAYRNMDVVNELADTPGSFAVTVRGLGRGERYDLRLDADRFVPGAKIRLVGPARILDGAKAWGLKLVEHRADKSIYEVLVGDELIRNRQFILGPNPRVKFMPGFYNLPIGEEFQLEVEYELPQVEIVRLPQLVKRRPINLVVQQFWKGQIVGAAGIRVNLPKVIRIPVPNNVIREVIPI